MSLLTAFELAPGIRLRRPHWLVMYLHILPNEDRPGFVHIIDHTGRPVDLCRDLSLEDINANDWEVF